MLSSPHHSDRKGAPLRIRQIAVAFIACLTAFPASAGPTISELVKQHDGLTTAKSVEFKHLVLTSGRLKLTFPSAIAAEVKAGDRTVGIFVKGDGAFQYTIDDAVEYPIAKRT